MKNILLKITILMLVTLSFGFKKKIDLSINKSLLCKQWETNAKDDASSKVVLTFYENNSYSHEYLTKGIPSKDRLIMKGKWSIGKDKKIYIDFDPSKTKDIFEVISIKENELVLNTSVGIKKFEIIKK